MKSRAEMVEEVVEVRNVVKRFGVTTALNNVSLNIHKGEFFTIIGPSGCGKTTLLKIVAGLEMPDSGQVLIDGKDVTRIPTAKRGISLVFQDFALFPHKTVFENIAFGLRMRGESADAVNGKVRDIMILVGLEGLGNRFPRQLSGGQQQRVAVARSLVVEPRVLLLDEPLGNLDFKLQRKLEVELKFLQERIGITFVYVTHNQEQAMVLGHRITVMNHGVIEQIGAPEEVYTSPQTVFVSKFVGEVNMLRGKVTQVIDNVCYVETDLGSFAGLKNEDVKVGTNVAYAIRPEKIVIGADSQNYSNKVKSPSFKKIYKGSEVEYLVNLDSRVQFKVTKPTTLQQEGEAIQLGWRTEDALIIEKPSVVENVDIERVILGA